MKLYYSPGACSLAAHITLHAMNASFEHDKVDLKAGRTESGEDFRRINPKGYVPALQLDDGALLTENVALLDWLASQGGGLVPPGPMGRTRLLELLAFISTEVHKSFKPFFQEGSDDEKRKAAEAIDKRLGFLADGLDTDFLLGDRPSVADAYLFVMLLWARKFELGVPAALERLRERMAMRDAVRTAMDHEGLS